MAAYVNNITTLTGPESLNAWLVDIRAHLRRNKLWDYTEREPKPDERHTRWEEAADLITPTLSPAVKQKLTDEEFNNGYLLKRRILELFRPSGEAEFMRLSREYYSLSYDATQGSISDFLTRVKVLEERIDATNVTLDNDKRTLLCLTMALSNQEHYRPLTQIWMATPDMTAERAKMMLLEEERRDKREGSWRAGEDAHGARYRSWKIQCFYCKKRGHREENCFEKYPEKRYEWASQQFAKDAFNTARHKREEKEIANIGEEVIEYLSDGDVC